MEQMKKKMVLMAEFAKSVAELALKRDANSTTCGAIYQPKAPEKLKRFKKSAK